MHIGLNLVFLVPGKTGGMETYARELITAMLALAGPDTRFTAFVNREAAAAPGPWNDLDRTIVVPVRATNRIEWVRGEQQHLPRLAAGEACELVHSLASTAPLWGRFKRVVTIHDLNYRIVPDAHFGVMGLGMRALVPAAAHRSHRIITDSASTRSDLLRFHRLDPGRIDVVPLGVRLDAGSRGLDEAEIRRRHRLGERAVLLCVAAKRRHKNLLRLIDALALIDQSERPVLVIAGYSTPHDQELAARARALEVSADLRLLSWLPDDELEGFYATAAAFVFPSLYEGFGLPVLEAMARGVPVATTDRGSLPEVAGAAALTFDPLSPAAIADAVTRLLRDHELAASLRQAGRERAAAFSWQRTGRETLDSYRRALAPPEPTP